MKKFLIRKAVFWSLPFLFKVYLCITDDVSYSIKSNSNSINQDLTELYIMQLFASS